MKMRGLILAVALCLPLIQGCKTATATTATQALAPGYLNPADQTMGEALAALNGFAAQEKLNYAAATPAIQAVEKAPLNDFILAVNLANASYTAYHAGTATQAQATTAIDNAQTAQTTLVAAQGVK